jgi:hypothetical protein
VTVPYDPDTAESHAWPPDEGSSELVARLRAMEWPEVTPEVRQRCWEQLSQQVEALVDPTRRLRAVDEDDRRGGGWQDGSHGRHERRFGRHEFATRGPRDAYTGALGERVAVARRAARTPAR